MDVMHAAEVYRLLFEASPDAMFIADETGLFLSANPAACSQVGYSLEELLGKRVVDIVPPEMQAEFFNTAAAVRKHGAYAHETMHRHRDGSLIPIHLRVTLIEYEGRKLMIGIARDLRERRGLEDELAHRSRVLDAVSRATNLLLTFTDEPNAVDAALEILGRTAQVDRVFLFEAHSDPESGAQAVSLHYEWTREGISRQIDNPVFQNVPFDAFPHWRDTLLRGEPILGHLSEFLAGINAMIAPWEMRSALVFPILIAGRPWGLVGFDDYREERAWDASEQTLLAVAARSIGGALARQRLQQKLQRTKQLHEALKHLREAVVYLGNQHAFFERVCRILMETGLFRMAWIGLLDEEQHVITPVAHDGAENGYLAEQAFPTADVPRGRGPAGTAVRLGSHRVCNNIALDSAMAPVREAALARGFHSVGAFPFRQHERVAGILEVYVGETGWFAREEVLLLDQCAAHISTALELMETERQRDWALEAMGDREQYLRAIWNSLYTGVLMLDADTYAIIEANPAALALLGRSEEEIAGKPSYQFVSSARRPREKSGSNLEYWLLSAGGDKIPVLRTIVPLELHGCQYLLESLVDIRALRSSGQRLSPRGGRSAEQRGK